MSCNQNKRKIKEKEKQNQQFTRNGDEDEDFMSSDNHHHHDRNNGLDVDEEVHSSNDYNEENNSEQEEDEQFYKNKLTKIVDIDLYVQLPEESQPELLKKIPALFTNTSCLLQESERESQQQAIQQTRGNNNQDDTTNADNSIGKEFKLRLADIIKFLKKQGYSLENVYVSYYSYTFSAYINCNLDPIPKTIWLGDDDFEIIKSSKSLKLKIQRGIGRQFKEEEEKENLAYSEVSPHVVPYDQLNQKSNRRSVRNRDSLGEDNNIANQAVKENNPQEQKIKERTVGYVIEKVQQWRRLYNGFYDQNHSHKRMSLEEAAEKVNVSKKSLDDYLAQLREGRQNGYDFNLNKDEKVGHLRRFVKAQKEKNKSKKQKQQQQQISNQGVDQADNSSNKRRKKQ